MHGTYNITVLLLVITVRKYSGPRLPAVYPDDLWFTLWRVTTVDFFLEGWSPQVVLCGR